MGAGGAEAGVLGIPSGRAADRGDYAQEHPEEVATRPTFDLKQQLAEMDRLKNASPAYDSFNAIAQFVHASGALASVPDAKQYIDDGPMKRVMSDPKLAAFANDGTK